MSVTNRAQGHAAPDRVDEDVAVVAWRLMDQYGCKQKCTWNKKLASRCIRLVLNRRRASFRVLTGVDLRGYLHRGLLGSFKEEFEMLQRSIKALFGQERSRLNVSFLSSLDAGVSKNKENKRLETAAGESSERERPPGPCCSTS